jgi:Dimerisation domain
MSNKPAPEEQILPLVMGFWQARALAVATELGLSDLLAEGPLHVGELGNRTKTNASALFRLLRALESIGIFVQSSPRVFSNTAERVSTQRCTRFTVVDSCALSGQGQWSLRRMESIGVCGENRKTVRREDLWVRLLGVAATQSASQCSYEWRDALGQYCHDTGGNRSLTIGANSQ